MSTCRRVSSLALVLLLFAQRAHAFFDPPYITPAEPAAGQTVSVHIRGGICDAIIQMEGFPQITRSGNVIRILFFGAHETDSESCVFYPIGTLVQPIGTYPAGTYTLQVDLYYANYPFGYAILNIGTVPFTVTGGSTQAVQAPVNNPWALALLALVMMGIAAFCLRRRRSMLPILLLACVPFGARAQDVPTIQVLVTDAAGAPTPAQIVAYYNSKPRSGAPPLQGLAGSNPKRGELPAAGTRKR